MARSWRIELPLTKPLSLNDRQHHYRRYRDQQAVKNAVILLCRTLRIPPLERVHVVLHYAPRDKRRRDSDNLVATLKPCCDGIVAAGVVPDDTPQYLIWAPPMIEAPTGRQGSLWLVVEELPG